MQFLGSGSKLARRVASFCEVCMIAVWSKCSRRRGLLLVILFPQNCCFEYVFAGKSQGGRWKVEFRGKDLVCEVASVTGGLLEKHIHIDKSDNRLEK